MEIRDIYSLAKSGRYWYTAGVNYRAFVAFVAGCLLPLSGFVASFGYTIGSAATKMYDLEWVSSFLMGGLCYLLVCRVCKVPGDDGRLRKMRWKSLMGCTQMRV